MFADLQEATVQILHYAKKLVGERGFQTRISLTQSDGNPQFLRDRQTLVQRLCAPVQCSPAMAKSFPLQRRFGP